MRSWMRWEVRLRGRRERVGKFERMEMRIWCFQLVFFGLGEWIWAYLVRQCINTGGGYRHFVDYIFPNSKIKEKQRHNPAETRQSRGKVRYISQNKAPIQQMHKLCRSRKYECANEEVSSLGFWQGCESCSPSGTSREGITGSLLDKPQGPPTDVSPNDEAQLAVLLSDGPQPSFASQSSSLRQPCQISSEPPRQDEMLTGWCRLISLEK
jgi:hypothetical protein